jgi:hypothetical protein
MATWKKLVVSGSDISQLNNDALYISASQVPAAGNSFSTASFNGTSLLADSSQGELNFASGSTGLNIVAAAGTDTLTFDLVSVPNASLANSAITIAGTSTALGESITADTIAGQISATTITNGQLVNDGITFGAADVSLGDTVTQLSLTGFTGSFTGTLADGVTATTQTPGDNSTKVATTAYVDAQVTAEDLDIAGDGSTTSAIDLDSQSLTFAGQDGLQLSASAQTITATIADASIANGKLANDGITIAGQDISLGGSITADIIAGQISATTITNGQLVNDGITIGDQDTSLGGSVLNNLTHSATGSFTGSFVGDGSGLTGLATTLNLTDGSNAQAIDLLTETLTFSGTANEVEISTATTDTVTIGLPDDVTIGQDLTVTRDATISRNLIVLGTASFQHTEDLDVADRFIRLASGSTSAGDGGIVIQQTGALDGEVFGFDSANTRFGMSGSFDASQNVFTPDAFMAAAVGTLVNGNDPNGAQDPGTRYNKKGNLYVAQDSQDIWIYS